MPLVNRDMPSPAMPFPLWSDLDEDLDAPGAGASTSSTDRQWLTFNELMNRIDRELAKKEAIYSELCRGKPAPASAATLGPGQQLPREDPQEVELAPVPTEEQEPARPVAPIPRSDAPRTGVTGRRIRNKVTHACEHCKVLRKRCSGEIPCTRCADFGNNCIYTDGPRQWKRDVGRRINPTPGGAAGQSGPGRARRGPHSRTSLQPLLPLPPRAPEPIAGFGGLPARADARLVQGPYDVAEPIAPRQELRQAGSGLWGGDGLMTAGLGTSAAYDYQHLYNGAGSWTAGTETRPAVQASHEGAEWMAAEPEAPPEIENLGEGYATWGAGREAVWPRPEFDGVPNLLGAGLAVDWSRLQFDGVDGLLQTVLEEE